MRWLRAFLSQAQNWGLFTALLAALGIRSGKTLDQFLNWVRAKSQRQQKLLLIFFRASVARTNFRQDCPSAYVAEGDWDEVIALLKSYR